MRVTTASSILIASFVALLAAADAQGRASLLVLRSEGRVAAAGTAVVGAVRFGPCGTVSGHGLLASNAMRSDEATFSSSEVTIGGCGEGGPVITGEVLRMVLSSNGDFRVLAKLTYSWERTRQCAYGIEQLKGRVALPGPATGEALAAGRRLRGSSAGCPSQERISGVSVSLLDAESGLPLQAEESSGQTPIFSGLKHATTCIPGPVKPGQTTSYELEWEPALEVDGSSSFTYNIYQATTPGGENYASPTYTTAAGATSFKTPLLSAEDTYYFVVRARDGAGHEDTNKIERVGEDMCA